MTKLNWEATNRRKRWAYTAPAPAGKVGLKVNPKVASAAALYSEINALSRRIELGKKMIDDLPFGDQRYWPWRHHLHMLMIQIANACETYKKPSA